MSTDTTEQSFIKAIRENPHDDDARLVYSQYLEEQGEVRGELMRLQIGLEKNPECEDNKKNKRRVEEIVEGHGTAMRDRYIELFGVKDTRVLKSKQTTFIRGLPTVELRSPVFLDVEADEIKKIPVESLELTGRVPRFMRSEVWQKITSCCPYVRDLHLANTGITDEGLSHLKNIVGMRIFSLKSKWQSIDEQKLLHEMAHGQDGFGFEPEITDAGLAHLEDKKEMRELILNSTGITDAGLEHLRAMTHLQVLSVWNTGITDAGVQELAKALGKTINDEGDPNTLRVLR